MNESLSTGYDFRGWYEFMGVEVLIPCCVCGRAADREPVRSSGRNDKGWLVDAIAVACSEHQRQVMFEMSAAFGSAGNSSPDAPAEPPRYLGMTFYRNDGLDAGGDHPHEHVRPDKSVPFDMSELANIAADDA